jgi:hypothetical protein
MSAAPYVLGGFLVGGVIIAAYEWNKRANAGAAKPPDAGSKCDKVQAFGPYAYAWCKVGEVVNPIVGGILGLGDEQKYDAENIKLNGAVTVPLDKALKGRATCPEVANVRTMFLGSALQFANGGVPFEGLPGWELCAPGTHSMWTHCGNGIEFVVQRNFNAAYPYTGTARTKYQQSGGLFGSGSHDDVASHLFLSGHLGDPFTFQAGPDTYYLAGRKVTLTCPPGQVVDPANIISALDTRTNVRTVIARCGAPGANMNPGPANSRTPGATSEQHITTTGPRSGSGTATVREHA